MVGEWIVNKILDLAAGICFCSAGILVSPLLLSPVWIHKGDRAGPGLGRLEYVNRL